MAPVQEAHQHRNTTKVNHKPFKSRHATKNLIRSLAKGKLEQSERVKKRRHLHQAMSKQERRNHARQLRQTKHAENARAVDIFTGQNGAPRILAVVPLSYDVDVARAIDTLNSAVSARRLGQGDRTVRVDRFKQNIHYLPRPRTPLEVLDACRMADYVLLLLSASQEPDARRDALLRSIESHGVSNVISIVQDINKSGPVKNHSQVLSYLKSYVNHFFPDQEKVLSLDNDSECCNTVRSICSGAPKGIKWREDRSWMMIEDVRWPGPLNEDALDVPAIVTGVVRGKPLQSNRLVQIGDWGCFQIDKITSTTFLPVEAHSTDHMNIDDGAEMGGLLQEPDETQEDISEFAIGDSMTQDIELVSNAESFAHRKGVLLDEHHYFPDDDDDTNAGGIRPMRRLPKGTSSYQAAWLQGALSDAESDFEDYSDENRDDSMDTSALLQDGTEGLDHRPLSELHEADQSDYPMSETFVDPSFEEDNVHLLEYRAQKRTAAEDDLEFPDEIELHPNALARERLARYRGLKSLKTSVWDTDEDRPHEPVDWNRLLQISDYKRAVKQVEADSSTGGIKPGTRVHVHLRSVPRSLHESHDPKRPLAMYSLLRQEQKRSVVQCSISLRSDESEALKSKSELIMQCGPRRFVVNPIFSPAGNTPNNVHKFLRYLHPGQTAVASFIAPITWGPVPVSFFRSAARPDDPLELVATGTCLPPSVSRVVAKRVILTGHPYKIHKKLVTIRYMFFNADDVNWFKALPLWTRRGRSGFIKESLGTHGYFKATFDAKINPQDAVGVSLYKRVWPRPARAWRPAGTTGVLSEGRVE